MDQINTGNHRLNMAIGENANPLTKDIFFLDSDMLYEIKGAIGSLHPLKKSLMQLGLGKWYIGHYKKKIWKAPLPFYVWKCSDCGGITFGNIHGYKNKLYCIHCSIP